MYFFLLIDRFGFANYRAAEIAFLRQVNMRLHRSPSRASH